MSTLYCPTADKHPSLAWSAEQSFCTQLGFALQRPARIAGTAAANEPEHEARSAPANLDAAECITGTYTISYNAASGLLALSGTLKVDGATYFVDDQLTIDRQGSFEPSLGGTPAGCRSATDAERRLTAWSVGELPADGPALKLLAGLALVSHLGLKPQRG
jgi:hypothetical protein